MSEWHKCHWTILIVDKMQWMRFSYSIWELLPIRKTPLLTVSKYVICLGMMLPKCDTKAFKWYNVPNNFILQIIIIHHLTLVLLKHCLRPKNGQTKRDKNKLLHLFPPFWIHIFSIELRFVYFFNWYHVTDLLKNSAAYVLQKNNFSLQHSDLI